MFILTPVTIFFAKSIQFFFCKIKFRVASHAVILSRWYRIGCGVELGHFIALGKLN
jgi:hypothetical protein